MATVIRRTIRSGLGLLILGGLLFFAGRIAWEMHRLKQMCTVVRYGTAVDDMRRIVTKFGFWNPLVEYDFEHAEPRSTKGQGNVWEIAIRAPSPVGDMQCLILHDETVVLGTKLVEPGLSNNRWRVCDAQ